MEKFSLVPMSPGIYVLVSHFVFIASTATYLDKAPVARTITALGVRDPGFFWAMPLLRQMTLCKLLVFFGVNFFIC